MYLHKSWSELSVSRSFRRHLFHSIITLQRVAFPSWNNSIEATTAAPPLGRPREARADLRGGGGFKDADQPGATWNLRDNYAVGFSPSHVMLLLVCNPTPNQNRQSANMWRATIYVLGGVNCRWALNHTIGI